MQLSVIIVSYNVKHYLEQCLYSVQRAVLGIDAEIIVIDNHSDDDSVEWLKPRFPAVRFISNNSNLGFARANNIALAQRTGKYVLFLNPDTLVAENLVKEGLAYMDSHPKAGALGFRMIDGNGAFLPESKRSFPSPLVSFFKLSGLARLFPRSALFNRYALGNTDPKQSQQVEVLAGACMLVKGEVIGELHGFDESYFMYGEDIDLSYRIRQLGFENHYFADAEVLHFKGGSSRKQRIVYIRHFYGAMQVFVRKHYAKGAAGILSPFISIAIATRAALSLAGSVFKQNLPLKTSFPTGRTLVVASQEEYDAILDMLREHSGAINLIDRITVDEIGKESGNLVFCAGTIPLTVIFEQLQLPGNKNNSLFFHMTRSEHIVGTGVFYEL